MLYNIIFTIFYNFFRSSAFSYVKLVLSLTMSVTDRPEDSTIQTAVQGAAFPVNLNNIILNMKHLIKKVVLAYFENCAQVYATTKWNFATKEIRPPLTGRPFFLLTFQIPYSWYTLCPFCLAFHRLTAENSSILLRNLSISCR